jgi:hypothetical protein
MLKLLNPDLEEILKVLMQDEEGIIEEEELKGVEEGEGFEVGGSGDGDEDEEEYEGLVPEDEEGLELDEEEWEEVDLEEDEEDEEW